MTLIPEDASVGVQSAFPQLTSRKEVYNMPAAFPKNQPEYVILSTNFDYWPFASPEAIIDFSVLLTADYNYRKIFDDNGVILLRKIL